MQSQHKELPRYNLKEAMGYLTYQANAAIRRRIAIELDKMGQPLTLEQFMGLIYIWDDDGKPQWVLGEKLYRNKSAITRLVRSIEAMGYIKRITCEKNEREKRLYMTDKGKSLMESIGQMLQEIYAYSAEVGIDPKELAICKDVLKRVRNNLD